MKIVCFDFFAVNLYVFHFILTYLVLSRAEQFLFFQNSRPFFAKKNSFELFMLSTILLKISIQKIALFSELFEYLVRKKRMELKDSSKPS